VKSLHTYVPRPHNESIKKIFFCLLHCLELGKWHKTEIGECTGTQVPSRISAPAAERAFAIAQPKPWSSATPAMKALLPRKSIGRPGLDPVPLTEAKTFPAFLLGSSAAFLLKGLTLVVLRGRVSGSMEVRRWKFEVTGENAVKQTLEADEEVAPAAVCVADTAVRVTAACMLTNEAAILFRMFPF
jgi:hypothetical protein